MKHQLGLLVPVALALGGSTALAAPEFRDGATALTGAACAGTVQEISPLGARQDTTLAVQCALTRNGVTTPVTTTAKTVCNQTPVVLPGGRLLFARISGISAGADHADATLEVRVPVAFDQPIDDAPLAVVSTTSAGTMLASVAVTVPFQPTPSPFARGDDIAVLGAWSGDTLPVAFSNDDGSFTVTRHLTGDFAGWSHQPNVQRVSGTFNGDPYTDFALVGGPEWQSIPLALSDGTGRFTIKNELAGDFGNLFGSSTAKAVTGDFNKDGYTDIALVGGVGWGSIPIAFSNGDGTFTVTNKPVATFPQRAAASGAKVVTGDFNKDSFTDIAVVVGATVTIAHSFGDGQFLVTDKTPSTPSSWGDPGTNFAMLAGQPGAQLVTGDFNKDGYTDLALAGGPGWSTIPLALSTGNGNFNIVLSPGAPSSSSNFSGWASSPGAKLLTGDFNKDGYTDLALTGVAGWQSIPVALSVGFGGFQITNFPVPGFAGHASEPNVRALTGDFNGDGFTDIALTGGPSWASIPVAFSTGFGNFAETNTAVNHLPAWSSDPTASVLVGQVNWN